MPNTKSRPRNVQNDAGGLTTTAKSFLESVKKDFCHPEAAPTAKKGHDMFLSMN